MSRLGLALDSPYLTPELLRTAHRRRSCRPATACCAPRCPSRSAPASSSTTSTPTSSTGRSTLHKELCAVLPARRRRRGHVHRVGGRRLTVTDRMTATPATARPVTPLDDPGRRRSAGSARGWTRLGEGTTVDPALADDLRRARRARRRAGPLRRPAAPPPSPPALAALAARTAAEDWAGRAGLGPATGLEQEMLSGHVEGQTLKFLVHATRARRVLEIGMFTGYSALAMAEALPDDGAAGRLRDRPGRRRVRPGLLRRLAGRRADRRPRSGRRRDTLTLAGRRRASRSTSSSSTPTRRATSTTSTTCSSGELLAPGASSASTTR